MQNLTLARRYATAIFRLASENGSVDAVGTDLSKTAAAIFENDDVRRFYLSPVFERSKKERALVAAFAPAGLDPIALHAMLLLVRKRRESLLPAIAQEYARLALAASGKDAVTIVSANPLAKDELAGIVARLEAAYKKTFAVTYRTDASLLGGMTITMGDRRVDASLAGRLDELSRDLFASRTP